MSALVEAWDRLDEAWQMAFALAWEAHCAGSVPVGAVVTDANGRVVSTGRSRRSERRAPAGQIAGTNLAHAELNALAQLPTGQYSDCTLSTTLEPCLLCTSAITHSHIGTVRYAAPDPLWSGVRRLPELNEHVARRWPEWVGPMSGPVATFSSVLVTIWHLQHFGDEHAVINAQGAFDARIVEVARGASPVIEALEGASLTDALPALADFVERY